MRIGWFIIGFLVGTFFGFKILDMLIEWIKGLI